MFASVCEKVENQATSRWAVASENIIVIVIIIIIIIIIIIN